MSTVYALEPWDAMRFEALCRSIEAVDDDRPERTRAEYVLRAVGLVIWGFIGAPACAHVLRGEAHAPRAAVALWALYGLAFCATIPRALPLAVRLALLAVQSAAALALSTRGIAGFEGLLLAVVAAEGAVVLPWRLALGFALVQVVALMAVVVPTHPARSALEIFGAHSTFVAFALTATYLHHRESRARRTLARVYAELLAAQDALAESSRNAERVRISRELHDSLGHHLTALSIQLELAARLADGRASEVVTRARGVSRSMLDEVRAVVAALRTEGPIDLPAALRALAANLPAPAVHLELAADTEAHVRSAEVAHALFRCAQEALTNAARHGAARNVWITLAHDAADDALALTVRDDGAGSAELHEGRGLTGLRERVAALGGRVEVRTAPGEGLTLAVRVPARREATGGAR